MTRAKALTVVALLMFSIATVGLVGETRVAAALASRPDNTFVTNGPVQAVVRDGNTIYLGGRFDRVGPRTGPGLEFALNGVQNPGLPEVSGGAGELQAVAADGTGGWYIGGLFTHVGGVARHNIAHIQSDHSVDLNFDPSPNAAIHALAVSSSTVYAAGLFTSIGGQTRNRIAALDATGTATAFNPNADAAVEALAVSGSGSIIYAGGRFTMIGGQPRLSIAALNAADGSATATFNPSAVDTVPPSNGLVLTLAISGSTLYAGGYFAAIGGVPRNNIAALMLGGALDGSATSFDPSATSGSCSACGGVDAIAASSTTVYAGGLFTTIGGQPRNYLAGLEPASGAATSFDPNPNGNILGLALSGSGSTVYAAGGFTAIGGQPRNFVAGVNAADGSAASFDPDPNAVASAIGVSASAVYVAGSFSSIGGLVRHSIAALNATDGTATGFDPNAGFGTGNATVYALAVTGSTVYAGGFFTSIGGQPRNYIAALNATDGSATTWNPGANSTVESLALSGSILYAGGDFTSIGGQPRNFLAALNLSGGSPTAFDPSANSSVATLAVSEPVLYVGGFFTSIAGQTRNKIAALSTAGGSATAWNPDATANANVLTIAIRGPTIYAGGDFTSMHGVNRKNIAALSAADGTPTGFDPQASDGVYSIAASDSSVFAAGFFSSIGGQPRSLLAELNPNDGSATSFDPGGAPGFGAFAVAVTSDGTLYAGGSFPTFELAAQQGIAEFRVAAEPAGSVPDGRPWLILLTGLGLFAAVWVRRTGRRARS